LPQQPMPPRSNLSVSFGTPWKAKPSDTIGNIIAAKRTPRNSYRIKGCIHI